MHLLLSVLVVLQHKWQMSHCAQVIHHLKKEATPAASSSDSSAAAHCDEDIGSSVRQGIKSQSVPLPVYSGELEDWRLFWWTGRQVFILVKIP